MWGLESFYDLSFLAEPSKRTLEILIGFWEEEAREGWVKKLSRGTSTVESDSKENCRFCFLRITNVALSYLFIKYLFETRSHVSQDGFHLPGSPGWPWTPDPPVSTNWVLGFRSFTIHHAFFYGVLEMEQRASCQRSKDSTQQATPQPLLQLLIHYPLSSTPSHILQLLRL